MFHLIGQIMSGLIAGMLAKLLMPGQDSGGLVLTAFIGLAGSAIGTFLGHAIFGANNHFAGWVAATLGAVAILVIYRLAVGRPRDYQHGFLNQ